MAVQGMLDNLEAEVLNHIFRGTAFTLLPAVDGDWGLALLTTAPAEDGTGAVEVANSGGYTRKALKRSATTSPKMAAAAQGANDYAESKLDQKISWPQATGNWGTIVGVALCTSTTYGGGSMVWYFDLSVDKTVQTDDIFELDVNKLVAKLR